MARTPKDFDCYRLWNLIEGDKTVEEWTELQFTLDDGALTDLPATDVIGRICSPKLVETLKPFDAGIHWLPVRLRRGNVEHVYFFMHFSSLPDVLDEQKTIYAGATFAIPHLSLAKAGHLPLICLRPLGKLTYVRGDVKEVVEKSGCTGIAFEKASAS